VRRTVAAAVAVFALTCIIIWHGSPDGDVIELGRYGHAVLDGQVPYRDFALEYPPGAIPIFALPAFGEFVTWFRLENALAWAAVIALVGALLATLRPHDRRNAVPVGAVALVPLVLGPSALMRFDGWAAAVALGALLALLRRRPTLALTLLALATLVKAWPIVLLPLFVLYRVPRRAVAAYAGVLAAGLVPFVAVAHAGSYNALMAQVNRHLEFESLGASVLFALGRPVHLYFESGSYSVAGSGADTIARLQSALEVALVVLVAVWYARSRRGDLELVRASVAAVAVVATLGKVLSPQYLLWLGPFAALADVAALALFAGACFAQRGLWTSPFHHLTDLKAPSVAMLAVRNGFVAATTAALLRGLRR
jgi:hypothetical protein